MNPHENRDLVIQVRNLKKKYTLGQYNSARFGSLISKRLRHLIGKRPIKDESENQWRDFWALKGVDLDVYRGETLGIIGVNGSGKSTLLKLLSRVTSPSEGEIGIRGLSASMLEIGTGFNADMTGRENIYLNGTILGMTRAEITKKLDEIIEFSECSDFIDTPVKRYSSGMYVRLAFSVSAFLDSDILMMDEVLAVGDTHFQKKCIDKMYSAAHDDNRTVLFVSHNMASIKQLCTRCIVLNRGEKIFDGDVDEAIHLYTNLTNARGLANLNGGQEKSHNGVSLLRASLPGAYENSINDEHVDLALTLQANHDEPNTHVLVVFRNVSNVAVGSYYLDKSLNLSAGDIVNEILHIDIAQLMIGTYSMDILLCKEQGTAVLPFAVFDHAIQFDRVLLGGARNIDWNNDSWSCIRLPDMHRKL